MTYNLKVFFASFGASLILWGGINTLSGNLSAFFLEQKLQSDPQIIAAQVAQLQLEEILKSEYPLRRRGHQPLELQAQSALSVYIKETDKAKILFTKNSETPLPVASITKLMTALVAIKNFSPDTQILIDQEIVDTQGEAGQLKAGEVFTIKDLLYLALMESSNDAAVALSKPLGTQEFVQRMNEETKRLELRHTRFVNPTGLDEPMQSNVSTASDLATLVRFIMTSYPQIFDILSQSELALIAPNGNFHHTMRNTNELLGYYEWPTKTLGGKTGTTPQAKQTLLFVVESPDRKGYIINVLLGSENRFQEMRQLLQWILESYLWK